MAFLRFARSQIVRPNLTVQGWSKVRTASTHQADLKPNLIEQASDIFQTPFNPTSYLLTHATIIASVETEEVPNVKLGSVTENGLQITRKYADYRIRQDTEKWINNNCFVPGTLITMADGTVKPIEEVNEGDLVLSHLGIPRMVKSTYTRQVDEELLEVKFRGNNQRIYATKEHPFFVFRPGSCVNCDTPIKRSSRAISQLLGKHYCSSPCYYEKKVANSELLKDRSGEFVEASDLTDCDFVTTPIIPLTEQVPLTLEQARLIGLFLAEGYYELNSRQDNERVGVMWAFHKNEENTLGRSVIDLMRKEFGIECACRTTGENSIAITTKTNRDAVDFFSNWVLGDGSNTKTLHPDLLTAPPQIQKEIVRGWFEGDGSFIETKTDFRLTGSTASVSLANQLHLILLRLGISARLCRAESVGRRRLVLDGITRIVDDPSKTYVSWAISCGGGWIDDFVLDTVYEDRYAITLEGRGGVQNTPALRFLNGYHLQIIENIDPIEYKGVVHNLEVDVDNSYIANGVGVHNCDAWSRPVILMAYKTFVGGQNFVEHVQVEELSKGRIIDAAARDIGDSVYVDILIATDKKHADLIKAIQSGRMDTLSMGCSIDFSICTKCGHFAVDETQMCPHIKYEKGNHYFDSKGVRRKVAELCGHQSVAPTGGVQFIEASWVESPAFTGAVLRNVLEPEQISEQAIKQAQEVLSQPPNKWVKEKLQKAAQLRNGQFDLGDEGDDEDGGGESEPEQTPIENLEDEVTTYVLQRVKKKIQEQMRSDREKDMASPENSTLGLNNTIIKEAIFNERRASYRAGVFALVKTASSDVDLVDRIARYNQSLGVDIPIDVYRTIVAVGSTSQFKNVEDYLRRCRVAAKRPFTKPECMTLIRLGKLLEVRHRFLKKNHQ